MGKGKTGIGLCFYNGGDKQKDTKVTRKKMRTNGWKEVTNQLNSLIHIQLHRSESILAPSWYGKCTSMTLAFCLEIREIH